MDADAMDRMLARTRGELNRAWLAMWQHLLDENPAESIAGRLYAQEPSLVLRGWDAAVASFAAAQHAAYVSAGQTSARWIAGEISKSARVSKKLPHFDALDPPALQWAEANRLQLIRDLTVEQRDLIRQALIGGARSGANPIVIAREFRNSIGLTAAQEEIVQNYRRQLEGGDLAAALERELSSGASDQTIGAAMRANKPLTSAQIDLAVNRYRDNFITLRSETIARTETQRVAHQGSAELYRQAISRGDISADQIERTWVHSPRARNKANEREFHREMHGQKRGWDEPFVSGRGVELRYPGDPDAGAEETIGCRCTVTTRLNAA